MRRGVSAPSGEWLHVGHIIAVVNAGMRRDRGQRGSSLAGSTRHDSELQQLGRFEEEIRPPKRSQVRAVPCLS